MKYRTLGATGLRVSEIGFGTWGIGGTSYGPTDDDLSRSCLRMALEKGVNFFDTADLYGDGRAEELLGEVFANVRDQVIITTKGGTLPHTTFNMPQDFSRNHMEKALTASLKRLRTDYVDIYLLHSPELEDLRGNEELFRILEEFKSRGLIRHFGLSARSPMDAIAGIQEFGFQIVEVNFNIIDLRAIDSGLFDLARERNVGIIGRTPLAFGYLSGTLTGSEKLSPLDHRANWPKSQLERWATAPDKFSFLYDDGRRTPTQSALRFCLEFSEISTVIPGMMRVAEVEEDLAASEDISPLSQEELEKTISVYRACEDEFYDKNFKKVKDDEE